MPLKIHFMSSHLDLFSENLDAVLDPTLKNAEAQSFLIFHGRLAEAL